MQNKKVEEWGQPRSQGISNPHPKGSEGSLWGGEMMVGVPLIKNVIIATVLFLYQLAYAGDIMRLIHILELSNKGKKLHCRHFSGYDPFSTLAATLLSSISPDEIIMEASYAEMDPHCRPFSTYHGSSIN